MKTSLEDSVSTLLRSGVLLCGATIAGGLLMAFTSGDGTVFATTAAVLRGATVPTDLLKPASLLAAGRHSPEAWVTVGLGLLVSLPALRVAWLVVAFARNGERRMSALAALVLGLLVGGYFLGGAH